MGWEEAEMGLEGAEMGWEEAEEAEMGWEEVEMGWEGAEMGSEEAEMGSEAVASVGAGWEVEVALVVVAWAKEEMVRFDKESTSCMDFLKDLQGNLANSSFHSVSACIR